MLSVSQQVNQIRRVLKPISLIDNEVIVEKIDNEVPDLYECASRVLRNQMYSNDWDELITGIDIIPEQKNTVVTFTSTKGINSFCCMIANVRTKQEKTIKSTVLYTNDIDFNIDKLPVVRTEAEFKRIDCGDVCFIKPNKMYVIKTKTREIYRGVSEVVNDIVFYVPQESLFEL